MFLPIYFAIFVKDPIIDRITEDKTVIVILAMSTKTENCAYCTDFFMISLDNKFSPQMLFLYI